MQQNSDTTYRVFDWNRKGLDGKPRELHLKESMESIDFDDFEPPLTPASAALVADCPYFHVEKHVPEAPQLIGEPDDFSIITCLTGSLECEGVLLNPGGFMLLPASSQPFILKPTTPDSTILVSRLPIH